MALCPKNSAIITCLATFMFFFVPLSLEAQPTFLPGEGWQEKFAPTLYVNNGDSAWVYPNDYRRVKYQDNWLYGCTGTENFDLASVTDSVAQTGTKIVEDGRAVDIGTLKPKVDCMYDFRNVIDTVSADIGGESKSFTYSECRTNVDNDTVHLPDEAEGTSKLTKGDTIAIYKGNTCVGSGVWKEQGTTIAAAGKGNFGWDYFDGLLEEGDVIKYEFYIVEDDLAYHPLEVEYTSCSELDIGICEDSGKYVGDAFHQVSSLSFSI